MEASRRSRLGEHLFMVLIAIICGLASGFGAIGFRALIKLFHSVFYGAAGDRVHELMALPWYWRLLAPAVGGMLVGPLVYFFAREAKGHGVPEVMEAVRLKGGTIRPRVVVVKALASALCIASGGSVGREGPIVQIGSALSSTIGQMMKVSRTQLRTIVGCGAAAGIAATFNAPIAGALFAVEIILGDFGVTQFSPIVISSVVATVVSRHFLGDFPAFIVPSYRLVSPFELVPYMVVGVVSGLASVFFITMLYASEDLFEKIPFPEYTKAALGGLMVGVMGIWLPHVFGVGYETINNGLVGAIPFVTLGLLLIAKMVATSITLGSGGSGGVFAPSLFLGAMTGGLLGTLVHQLFPAHTATSGAYALVTMGAFVAGVTHAPITAIIMIFELTDDYTIIPPLMAACVVSTLVATLIKRDSVYTLKLKRRGIDVLAESDPNILRNMRVADILYEDPEIIQDSASYDSVIETVVRSNHNVFFVVDEKGYLLGTISLSELRVLIFQDREIQAVTRARDLVRQDIATVTADETLDVVAQIMAGINTDELAVVDKENPRRIIGSVREQDLLEAYNKGIEAQNMAGGLASTMLALDRLHRVDIGDGYELAEIFAPREFAGKSLVELDMRAKYDVQVIFVRSRVSSSDKGEILVPSPDYRIKETDSLVIAGPKEKVVVVASL